METVNALKVRNNLGKILDRLEKTREPILISKGRKICAVLVTPEDFETRFLIPILNAGILRHPMTEDLALKANRFVKKGLKINQIFFSKSQDMYNF
ncbi:MAG TPA: type II toxin-antitoxin system Phd/YefM family antitoxin [Deltaproteobacteria bacterium]|nr:type II toxin-antitoxin system Phd/YefM family antitoxin [Deltaproteobacteria bacterium]